jgi:Flp pilus assembly CpaF family ATPase
MHVRMGGGERRHLMKIVISGATGPAGSKTALNRRQT